ncbi:MAG: ATP synthase F1 subunit epsilon [Erysipelotrichaceae bacterium]|nr:ATP synthase F1 subunit epsilon [Erysipelotrichaceae bacterium]
MFKVKIITPIGLYDELEATILNVTTPAGMRGILSNHMPIVTTLDVGKVTIGLESPTHSYRYDYVSGKGILYFRDNMATVLVDDIERSDEINPAEVEMEIAEVQTKIKEARRDEALRELHQSELRKLKMKLKISEK